MQENHYGRKFQRQDCIEEDTLQLQAPEEYRIEASLGTHNLSQSGIDPTNMTVEESLHSLLNLFSWLFHYYNINNVDSRLFREQPF